MHNVTDVRHGRRMVRIRSSVLVRRRASMVLVCIRRRLGVKHPGCNTERRQQQEHTRGCTQAQGAQTAPIPVSQAAVSPQSATESYDFSKACFTTTTPPAAHHTQTCCLILAWHLAHSKENNAIPPMSKRLRIATYEATPAAWLTVCRCVRKVSQYILRLHLLSLCFYMYYFLIKIQKNSLLLHI